MAQMITSLPVSVGQAPVVPKPGSDVKSSHSTEWISQLGFRSPAGQPSSSTPTPGNLVSSALFKDDTKDLSLTKSQPTTSFPCLPPLPADVPANPASPSAAIKTGIDPASSAKYGPKTFQPKAAVPNISTSPALISRPPGSTKVTQVTEVTQTAAAGNGVMSNPPSAAPSSATPYALCPTPSASKVGNKKVDPLSPDFKLETNANGKPAHSYATLITYAIQHSPKKQMTLNEIYNWILDNFPYYRTAGGGWKNSIRHNLSLNKSFVRVPRPMREHGKGAYWAISEQKLAATGKQLSRPRAISDPAPYRMDSKTQRPYIPGPRSAPAHTSYKSPGFPSAAQYGYPMGTMQALPMNYPYHSMPYGSGLGTSSVMTTEGDVLDPNIMPLYSSAMPPTLLSSTAYPTAESKFGIPTSQPIYPYHSPSPDMYTTTANPALMGGSIYPPQPSQLYGLDSADVAAMDPYASSLPQPPPDPNAIFSYGPTTMAPSMSAGPYPTAASSLHPSYFQPMGVTATAPRSAHKQGMMRNVPEPSPPQSSTTLASNSIPTQSFAQPRMSQSASGQFYLSEQPGMGLGPMEKYGAASVSDFSPWPATIPEGYGSVAQDQFKADVDEGDALDHVVDWSSMME
ncbi:uncharacterized protein BJ171DRAFT_73384 [Polychytrium aggregatum]|uniref:uncharacterized protein n=1 Tax=Polychytrium aggregatum TaxID=110093 RepID=UPI0022FF044A|nr:uncharacterized protein BJ171DRAFT_73384 [Polychytrium aggregatum]KAI9205424.1 hypothetical protein BJ171DRAFT_73384 [Polychytrium aggregatum]